MESKGKKLICGLIIDEMHIKESVTFKGDRLMGYVNYGTGTDGCDGLPKATQALVFMLVAINSNWKVPVGYFLINGIGSTEKSNLVNTCIELVHEIGVQIRTLTFDGTVSNFSMAKYLGADLSMPYPKPFFKHESGIVVHILLDAAHMLKLCRNTLGDWKTLYDESMKPIRWSFFQNLVSIQEEIGLHVGTKIRTRHIRYHKEKMKVRLAAQTFSSSVANALEYCSKTLNLNSFADCNTTITFCKNLNNIFDFLNTRNFLSKAQYKRPLKRENESDIFCFIDDSIKYLQSLHCEIGKDSSKTIVPVIKSTRKTGFIGLIISLQSIKNMFIDTVMTKELEFLLTYKMSQDHLEIFFSAIRSRGGFNNNPTALQFESSFKRLLVHTEIMTSSGANCMVMDMTKILWVSSSTSKPVENSNIYLDMLCAEIEDDDINFNTNQFNVLQQVVEDIVEYIAGFIVRKLSRKLICDECTEVLTRTNIESGSLINIKSRGGLINPSVDVIYLCKVAERIFNSYKSLIPTKPNIINYLIIKASSQINLKNIFIVLADHFLNQNPLDNHLLKLTHLIFKTYFRIRVNHFTLSESQPKERIRSFLTKTIHFKNQ